MKITDQEVMRVADLARLRFTPSEHADLSVQLNRILEYFDSLSDVETEGIEPLTHSLPSVRALRFDDEQPCMPLQAVFLNAPDRRNNLFKVPKVIAG